jgi:electron-transferring-flavoprotein dehydrogenase
LNQWTDAMTGPAREEMDYDVVIVGAGPSGLAAAIRLKQLDPDLDVVVLEKGSEVGAHILSGAVLDPAPLNRLIPDWKEKGAPIEVPVAEDRFFILRARGAFAVPTWPMPPILSNHGCYIVSMGNVCRWMAEQAEALGVEIFPGMAASELVFDEAGTVRGVVAGEFGLAKDGTPGPNYEPGMVLAAKYVLLGEGARGSLAKQVIARYGLDAKSRAAEIRPRDEGNLGHRPGEKHREGTVIHTMGWPLGRNAGGGSFVYHGANNQVYVGFAVHLNYENPYLSPYEEFQRFKHHPMIARLLSGGKARRLWRAGADRGRLAVDPKVDFPGGALLGCSAGLSTCRGSRATTTPCWSGIEAAEAAEGDRGRPRAATG